MRRFIQYFWLLCCGCPGLAQASIVVDGFEALSNWEVKEWGDGAQLSLGKTHVTEGQSSLDVKLDPKSKKADNKGLILRKGFSGRPENLRKIEVDVFNGLNQPIEFAVALEADEFYEAPKIKLQAGWNRSVAFDLMATNFKSAASNWEYKTGIKKGAAIGNIFLIIYDGVIAEGNLSIDNLRVQEWGNSLSLLQERKSVAKAPRQVHIHKSLGQVRQGQKFEVSFDFNAIYHNPYNPDEINVEALFMAPSGRQIRMPGFLASGEVSLRDPVQNPEWKVRISPDEVGVWGYSIFVKNAKGEAHSMVQTFRVEAATTRGFVRVDPKDRHYFSFDSGEFFYPIGQNAGWDSDENYRKMFSEMKNAGENWTRVWMSNWSFGLEWKEMGFFRGLGNYNLVNAERLDKLLDLAAQNDIYMQLVFDFHGALSSKVNAEWMNNPYNKANGGMLSQADQFWTDPSARELYKRRIRYIVARWGYSPNIMAWEFFNETNFADNFSPEHESAFVKDVSAYLKDLDPYKHLITTSYYDYYNKKTYELPTIDYTQYHAYQKRVVKTMQVVVDRFKRFNKPFFFGEFGNNSADGVDDADKKGIFLHAGLWSQAMQPVGGNAMPWWWNTHIAPNNLYYHFKALSAYLKGLDRRGQDWQSIREEWAIQRRLGLDEKLIFQGLRSSDQMLGWIADSRSFRAEDGGNSKDWEKVQFKTQWPKDGLFAVEYWDTLRGEVIKKTELRSKEGRLVLELPAFRNDIAFKINRKNEQTQLAGQLK